MKIWRLRSLLPPLPHRNCMDEQGTLVAPDDRKSCFHCHRKRGGGHSCFKDNDEVMMRAKRKEFWEKAVDVDDSCAMGETWWGIRGHMHDDFNHSSKAIIIYRTFSDQQVCGVSIGCLLGIPTGHWSLPHQTRYDPAHALDSIIEEGRFGLFQRLGLIMLESSVFNGHSNGLSLDICPYLVF